MKRLTGILADIFDVPAEAAGQPRVTVTGGRRLHVENHRGITGYDPAEVRINCPGGTVAVTGRSLRIRAMSSRELVVTGDIRAVEFTG